MGRTINLQVTEEGRRPQHLYASHAECLKIVLLKPRIPQNAGSVARMCAATGCSLDLVEPFFQIDDKKLKRAGLDYWQFLDVTTFSSVDDWLEKRNITTADNVWFVEVKAPQHYTSAKFQKMDYLVFGDEQDGVPEEWLARWPARHIDIPQKNVRSLNLATSVGIVTYEALRQLGWYSIK